MTLRTAHGNARKLGAIAVIETLPVDELPEGVPGPCLPAQAHRGRAGGFVAGEPHTIAQARSGGRSRKARTALAHTLAVTTSDPAFKKYLGQAEAFRRAQVRILASSVGGGMCGPAPAALVASAALALAGSRYAYSGGDLQLGARLAGEVRQHLLGAHELCAREAAARPNKPSRLAELRAKAQTQTPPKDPPK